MSAESPLQGWQVLVTRAPEQCFAVSELLRARGAVPIEMPMISIGPPESFEKLDGAIASISSYDWIIFASGNAVERFYERMTHTGVKLTAAPPVAAIGASTAQRARELGFNVSFHPSEFIADSLVSEFPEPVSGKRFLWPKTNIGRLLIKEEFTAHGGTVDIVECYRTAGPADPQKSASDLRALIDARKLNAITLASAQTAKNLGTVLSLFTSDPAKDLRDVVVACIGPETAQSARTHLGKADVVADEHTMERLVDALEKFARDSFSPAS